MTRRAVRAALRLLIRHGMVDAGDIGDALGRMSPESRYFAMRQYLLLASGTDGELSYVSPPDEVIGRRIFMEGNFGRDTVEAMLALLPSSLTRGRFIDVGANIGMTAITALRLGGFSEAICFEPRLDLLPVLRANLALNGLHSEVTVHGVALSSEPGPISFLVDEDNLGDGRVGTGERSSRLGGATTSRVVVGATGAELLGSIDPGSDVLWMDVQGHEIDVLLGLELRRGVPITCLELDPALLEPRWPVDSTVEVLRQLGYRSFVQLGARSEVGPRPIESGLDGVLSDLRAGHAWGDFLLLP